MLLRFKDAPQAECGEVNALLDEHIGHVERRIGELVALEKQLRRLRAQCRKAETAGKCGILWELARAPKTTKAARAVHVAGSHRRAG